MRNRHYELPMKFILSKPDYYLVGWSVEYEPLH
jgi:hypothetical protein